MNNQNKDYYSKIYDYLIRKNLAFCWTKEGEFITREKCLSFIK